MKNIILVSLMAIAYSAANAQNSSQLDPCDGNTCVTNKVDPKDFIRHTPHELTRLSKEKYKIGDFTCQNIPFYRFKQANSDQLVLDVAPRLGTLIKIDRENDCDDHKESEAVLINVNENEHYAVTSFDGNPVFFDKLYFNIITDDTLWCQGLPAEPTRYHLCKLCGKKYSTQLFWSKDKIDATKRSVTYHQAGGCSNSTTGSHDNLTKGTVTPCGLRGRSY